MNSLTATGWPRPIVGGWPVPWVSPRDDLSTMDKGREAACASGAICAVCGMGYGEGETAFCLVMKPDHPIVLADVEVQPIDNAVMHQRCAQLAVAHCPRLKALAAGDLIEVVTVPANMGRVHIGDDAVPRPRFDGAECEIVTGRDE